MSKSVKTAMSKGYPLYTASSTVLFAPPTKEEEGRLARARDDERFRAFDAEVNRMTAALTERYSAASHALNLLIWENDAFRARLHSLLKRYRKNGLPPGTVSEVKDHAEMIESEARSRRKKSPTARELFSALAIFHGLTEGQIKNILYPVKGRSPR